MTPADLESLHIAELHARAAKAGVSGFRGLRREELISAIADAGGGGDGGEQRPARAPRRRASRERAPRAEGSKKRERQPREEPPEDEEVEPAGGVLDITSQGHGFIRLSGLERGDDDVYVSASQIRRCALRQGDEVTGPARSPRRGERHRALVHVDTVNGGEPQGDERGDFDSLKPVPPTRRLPLGGADPLVKAADRLAPLAFGQRVLVDAAPRSGRTTLLRSLATTLTAQDGVEVVVLLVDERPEEATAWREALPDAQLAIATAEMSPAEQLRVAELGLARAARLAERGADAVLIVDSLSRIAAAGDVAPVKRIFGSGRELEGDETGSLTVIATTVDSGDEAARAVITTENALIGLSADLAAQGVVPIDVARTRASGEERILTEDELAELRSLRGEIADLPPAEAAARLSS